MSLPLAELTRRCRILARLAEYKRAGVIDGIWCGDIERAGGPRIQLKGAHLFDDHTTDSERFTWDDAAAFLEGLAAADALKAKRKSAAKETAAPRKRMRK